MNFTHRSNEKELLDNDDIPFEDIVVNMRELNVVNKLLGGHRITQKGVSFFTRNDARGRTLAIAEIGCGGGDNLLAIKEFADRLKVPVQLTGIDIKPECIEYARQNTPTDFKWICSDYRNVTWPENKPDIIFSSLFCHHFTDEELVQQLTWLKKNAKQGFFINDLHRHPAAYYSISILTRLFSKSYLVKNDGPLSVRRAFRKNEWQQLLAAAGIEKYQVSWQWAFRYLICVANG